MSVFNGGPYGRLAFMLNTLSSLNIEIIIIFFYYYYYIEPRHEKTGLRGFRPGQIQTGLYSYMLKISDLGSTGIVYNTVPERGSVNMRGPEKFVP